MPWLPSPIQRPDEASSGHLDSDQTLRSSSKLSVDQCSGATQVDCLFVLRISEQSYEIFRNTET